MTTNYIKYNKLRSPIELDSLVFTFTPLKKLITLVLLLFFSFNAKSLMLSEGGNVYYECLGDGDSLGTNKYKFYFITYIICDFSTAGFNSLEFRLINADTFYSTLDLSLDSVTTIPNPVFECSSIPSNTCLKKFTLSTIIDLPISNDSYLFVAKFCCRSIFLINTELGNSIYYTEITSLSQTLQNSGPSIQSSPPSILCKGYPLSLPMTEIDNEGHQLIYTLCNPLGKTLGGLDTFPLNPFPVLPFKPGYSYLYPLGLNTPISLDPNTGTMSGVLDSVGKYVVGYCISEYYNGQLLSKSVVDITLNVEDCAPHVFADISNADEFIDDTHIFNLCNETQLTIQNQSIDSNYITELFWVIEINNQLDTFYEWNPTITFPSNGIYNGQLIINPTQDCSDTAHVLVNVNELLEASFDIEYDTCVGGEVSFINESISQGGNISQWNWDFGDGEVSDIEFPFHQFQQPGNQMTTLTIINDYNCKDTVTKIFEWLPAPPIIIVAPSTFEGCNPLSVYFENLSTPIDSTYDIVWDFGNGESSIETNPEFTYLDEGIYNISVSITSPIGCQIDTVFNDWIKVTPRPQANFSWQENYISNLNPEIQFVNHSTEAIAWEWKVNDQIISFEKEPTYFFQDTGIHYINLTVYDQYNCVDSLLYNIDVIPESTYFLPNAFSPNGDGVNDIFLGKGKTQNIISFEMVIYNRWGEVIFQTQNPVQGWDGRDIKTNRLVPQGVYTCEVKYLKSRNISKNIHKSIMLIR